MNLFDFVYDRIYFPKEHKIRFFEAFSGIGCQSMALKKITNNFEIVGISEIDKYALQSYKAIHGDVKNYGGIGSFERFPKDIDICTWSFPCQDISLAGKQRGLVDGTRSNYGYEFLETVKRTPKEERPKVLIMENVKALFSVKFKEDWREIQRRLKELGYMSYAQVLNGKDYGVAQNRERIFIVSVMGEYNYVFPEKIPLTKRLKDYLEDTVDEKYYLSDKVLKQILNWKSYQNPLDSVLGNESVVPTITTRIAESPDGGINASMKVLCEEIDESIDIKQEMLKDEPLIANALRSREFETGGWKEISPTLCARDYKDPKVVFIPEATEQGYAEAYDGDGVYINQPHQKRGVVQHDMIQTIKTMPNDVGVVVKTSNEETKVYKTREDDMPRHRIYTDDSVGFTITTNESQMPSIVEEQPSILQKARGNNKGGLHEISPTITSNAFQENNHLVNGLKIRKLTPRECWRLMGISDDDFDKAQASGMSNAQLYKQAGNGIVVDVFEAILSQMIERNK